jgi:hypothetical protein
MKALALPVVVSAVLLFACASTTGGLKKAPDVEVPLRQSAVYSGESQPISIHISEEDAPLVITYFDSLEALEQEKDAKSEAPVEGGLYYVRIERPEGNGYDAGDSLIVEYRIEPKEVYIIAEDRQEAIYDGNPKRIKAAADAPVPLSYSYFPNRESMLTVFRRAEVQSERRSNVPRGYTRVERPPIEPGTYYVLVYYNGDRNYQSVSKEIGFTIKPRY